MSQPDRSPEMPHITIEGTQKQSLYFLQRGDSRRAMDDYKFRIISILNARAPSLVYVTTIIGENVYSDYSAYQQRVTERMHQLSQPEELGAELLQPEFHGAAIVGYRLTERISVVDNRRLLVVSKPSEPRHEPLGRGWRRLLPN